jgi:acetyltransferase-like isoleucine patch superfamily enzyme
VVPFYPVTACSLGVILIRRPVLRPVHEATSGCDGFVSLEVSPYLATSTKATIAEAWRLREAVHRDNLMIKVLATKPGVVVKFPWRLEIGDHSWIGEHVWLDNLAEIRIGSHCCLSQGAYLCTGSHDWSRSSFNLMTKPIVVQDQVWLAARSIVGPGVTVGSGAVLSLGSIATRDLPAWHIHQGSPAIPVKPRLAQLTERRHHQQTSSS